MFFSKRLLVVVMQPMDFQSIVVELKKLPVDCLKIGTAFAFVRNIIKYPINLALFESINQVGHIMGIKTTAEYIENKGIYEKLENIGVDYAQGYYVSWPMPLDEINLKELNYLS